MKARNDAPDGKKLVASNRKARYDYEILEVLEAGLSLVGAEVKSLRLGRAVLEGSFARLDDGELYLYNLHIAPYSFARMEEAPEAKRTRKLLVHHGDLKRLSSKMKGKALTLVPLELYFKHGWAKVELALAKGKKGKDRRDSIKKKDQERELDRTFKGKFKL